VIPVGPRSDFVVSAGGYLGVTHGILRHTANKGLRNAGDRTLTRVDPKTGHKRVVGQLAPCGLTADPSGDVWVANCYASGRAAVRPRRESRVDRPGLGDGVWVTLCPRA
jgi:hypothetical protein